MKLALRQPAEGRARAALARMAACLLLAGVVAGGCSAPRPSADFWSQPAAPSVNELVYFSDCSSPANSTNDIIAWEWDFGDGGTATGQGVWHQFRSTNDESPWYVTLTVTDVAQNEGVRRKSIPVRGGADSGACGYTMQAVGTACERPDDAQPSIPVASQLPLQRGDVWTSWWEVPRSGTLFLLVQVYFPYLPGSESAHRMNCRWSIYYEGDRGTDRPVLVGAARSDSRLAEAGTAYGVGFPLRLEVEQDLATPGWYLVFADIETGDGNRRTVTDFLINAGGAELQDQ